MIGKGFKYASCNFLESEHGKGAPDRVGAALKRAAHSFVLHGKDITNTSTFTNCFKDKESNISLYEVCKYNIEKNCKFLASLKLKPVPVRLNCTRSQRHQ